MSTPSSFPVRQMPRLARWPHVVVFVVWAALVALVTYYSWWFALLPLSTVIALMVYFERRIRCPQCRNRVQPRNEELPNVPGAWQRFYDCPRCQITWDPEMTFYDAA
jgi:hypothetical protein